MAVRVTALPTFGILAFQTWTAFASLASPSQSSARTWENHAPAGVVSGAHVGTIGRQLRGLQSEHRSGSVVEPSKVRHSAPRVHQRRLKVRTKGGHQSSSPAVHKPKLHGRSGGLKRRHHESAGFAVKHNSSCSLDLRTQFSGITFDYICDVTDAILHNDGDGTTNWELAQPVSGCHQYAAYWNQEHKKPLCYVGQTCSVCSDSRDLVKMTVYLEGGTCKPCGPDALPLTPADASTADAATTTAIEPEPAPSGFDLAGANGDGVAGATSGARPSVEDIEATYEAMEEPGMTPFTLADARDTAQAAIIAEEEALKAASAEEAPAEMKVAALLAKSMEDELNQSAPEIPHAASLVIPQLEHHQAVAVSVPNSAGSSPMPVSKKSLS